MRDPSWMQLSAQYRKAPPPPPPVPADAEEHALATPTVPDVDDEAPYLGAWLRYKRHWREIWLNGVVGWITLFVLAQLLERTDAGNTVLGALWPVWALVWFVMGAISAIGIIGFACPRCGGSFFTVMKPFTSQLKCPRCGLRKFQVNDAGKSLWQLKRPK